MLQRSTKLFENIVQKIRNQNLFTSAVHLTKIGDLLETWKDRFKQEQIPEPLESIQHILAFNLGTRNVSIRVRSMLTFSW